MHLDQVIEAINSIGTFDINASDDILMFETEFFYVRIFVYDQEFQFGVKKNFDRWANSVDFAYHGMPEDDLGIAAIFEAANECYRKDLYNPAISEEFDLAGEYRAARQRLKERQRKTELFLTPTRKSRRRTKAKKRLATN